MLCLYSARLIQKRVTKIFLILFFLSVSFFPSLFWNFLSSPFGEGPGVRWGEAFSQTIFYSENFNSGGTGWSLNLPGTGTNAANANAWMINSDASCTCQSGGNNKLHITCDTSDSNCPLFGGPGCTYNAGGLTAIATDKFASSPNISTVGKTNITLKFRYVSGGETGSDYGNVRLSSNGGTTWTDLATKYAGNATCTQASIAVPVAYENISDFRIAFRWINNDNSNGNDPPFSVDDIELSTPSGTGINEYEKNSAQNIRAYFNQSSGEIIVLSEKDFSLVKLSVFNLLGEEIFASRKNLYSGTNSFSLNSLFSPGIYFIAVSDNENLIYRTKFIRK